MARKHTNRYEDLTPYTDCPCDELLGFDPLAIGWLNRKRPFTTGKIPDGFLEKLVLFCLPENTVCPLPRQRPCTLANHPVPAINHNGREIPLGTAEIRVIGEEEIYAASTLIYHYIKDHNYLPPQEFIDALLNGPQPGSSEFRALIRALQAADSY